MLYVIGLSQFEFVTIKSNSLVSVSDTGRMEVQPMIIGVECHVPNNKATFFNNISDAVGVMENIRKKGDEIKFESFIGESVPTIDDLHIYQLSAEVVDM